MNEPTAGTADLEELFEAIEKSLPPFFQRKSVGELTQGAVSANTLANLASKNQGPPYAEFKRKVFYLKEPFMKWLREEY